jgi:hypothetical protein
MKRMALIGLVLMAWAGSAAAAELVHSPVMSAAAGQDLVLDASLVGAPANARVRVYYRAHGKEIYRSFEMQGSQGALEGSIPGDTVDADGLEYYLEAASFSNNVKTVVATYPRVNPALAPVQVVVRVDETPPELQPLSPADGDQVDTSRPVVTLAWADADSGLDLATAQLTVDGKPVEGKSLQVLDALLTWLPDDDLADGKHSVTVSIKDKAGNLAKATWGFTVAASGAAKPSTAKGWSSDASLGLETLYGAVLQAPAHQPLSLPYAAYGANRGDLLATTRSDSDTLSLKVHATDEDRWEQQPLDRYTATWEDKDQGILTLGDIANTSFSELSIWQLPELRGVSADLRSGPLDGNHSRFIGVWGQTQRAVEAGPVPGATYTAQATYAQYLYGARWESEGPHFGWNWNAVTINDDVASVKDPGGALPNYNTIISTDAKLAAPEIWLTVRGEAAFDWDFGTADFTGLSVGGGDRVNATWDAKPLGTLATIEYRDLGGSVTGLTQVLHDKVNNSVPNGLPVPGDYNSMGNPGLLADYRGFESSLSQRLLDGQLSFSGNLNQWRDNLQLTKAVTTETFFYSAFVNVAPHDLPSLSLGYTRNRADGQPADWGAAVPTTFTTGAPMDLVTGSLNVTLGDTFVLAAQQSLAVNMTWVQVSQRDQDLLRVTPDMDTWNLVLSGFYNRGSSSFSVTGGLGGSSSPLASLTGLTVTPVVQVGAMSGQSASVGAHWMQQWLGGPFSSNLGWDFNSTDNAIAASASSLASKNNSLRNTFSANGAYKLTKAQRLSLTLAWAMQQTAVDLGDGSGEADASLGELYSDLRYDISF